MRLSPWRHRNGYEGYPALMRRGTGGKCAAALALSRGTGSNHRRGGGGCSPSERARPMGWGVGVRASRPASRAPAGAKGPKPNAPPGNDPLPSLPGPSAGSHCAGLLNCTQSRTTALSALQSRAWCEDVELGELPHPHLKHAFRFFWPAES